MVAKRALRVAGPGEEAVSAPVTPWAALGFGTERDMMLDDFKELDSRIKSPTTTATAVAALSKRKQEVFAAIKAFDLSEDDPDDILAGGVEDEAWDVGG